MIKKINKILVPLDGSKNSIQGLEMAISIAMQFGATITGTYSISAQPHSEFQGVDYIKNEFGKEIKRTIEKAMILSTKKGIEFKEKIMRGDVGYNIIKLAHDKKEKYDLIVSSSRAEAQLENYF